MLEMWSWRDRSLPWPARYRLKWELAAKGIWSLSSPDQAYSDLSRPRNHSRGRQSGSVDQIPASDSTACCFYDCSDLAPLCAS